MPAADKVDEAPSAELGSGRVVSLPVFSSMGKVAFAIAGAGEAMAFEIGSMERCPRFGASLTTAIANGGSIHSIAFEQTAPDAEAAHHPPGTAVEEMIVGAG